MRKKICNILLISLLFFSVFSNIFLSSADDPMTGISILNTILIDDTADYNLLDIDVDRIVDKRIYQNQVLTTGHLPFILIFEADDNITLNKGQIEKLLTHEIIDITGNKNADFSYWILVNETYLREVPVYENQSYTIPFFNNITRTWENKTGYRKVHVGYDIVEDYRYVWKETKNLQGHYFKNLDFVVLDVSGKFTASLNNWGIDVAPTVELLDYKNTFTEWAWWNGNWDYYKICSISDKYDDYKMKLIVGNSTGGNVTCGGHAKSDFGDIRFINTANDTEYPFWLVNYTADTQATFWVNNSDNASQILMYYGNSIASTTSTDFREDLSTYTEDDPDTRITVNSTRCTKASEPCSEDATWVYKDMGVGYFGDYEHSFTMNTTASSGGDSTTVYWGVGNVLEGWYSAYTAENELIVITGGGNEYLSIKNCEDHTGDDYAFSFNTIYYCTVERASTTFTCKIYSDAGRTNLLDTLSAVTSTTTMRYVFVHDCADVAGTDTQSGYTENLFLRKIVSPEPAWSSFGSEQSAPNTAPTQSGEVPANTSTGISRTPSLYVLCNDADNDNLNATWWSNSSGSWLQFASNWTSFADGTNITQSFTNATAYSTKYYWSVNLTDGEDWNNETYHFTTEDAPAPPTNFVASTYTAHIINLTWTKGVNTDYTRIQNKTGSYPTSISDGLLVYNGTLTSYNHTGLTNDTVYYYGAWGYNSVNNEWSTTSINATNYTVVDPTVTTNASTGVEETDATLRGFLSDYGGEDCLVWFEYGTTTGYGSKTTNQTVANRTEFNDDVTGLSEGTYYHYRAAANNSRSTTYGSDLTFITKPLEPNTLTVTKHSGTAINISWVKGSGTNNTRIQNETGAYPATYSDGYNVYNSTLTYVLHTGLGGGNTYYYRGWSWANWSGLWKFSDSYDEGTLLLVPDSPYALTVTTYGDTWINLSWSKGNGTVNTVIRNDTTAYPTDYNSNNLTYNDTGTWVNTTGLTPSTQYYFRAWSYSNETYNDTYVQVAQYTKPSVPSGFTASTYNTTRIDLAWTKGTGATKTRVQRKIDDYPTGVTDGTNVYNDTGTSYSNTGLTNATLYYYRAWSWHSASNLYSTFNVSTANLTKPDAPISINVSYYNATSFNITWLKNAQANTTVVRRYNGSTYPTLTTGILVYNASGKAQVYDNDTATNTEYRYTLWSWIENGSYNQYSAPVNLVWGFTTLYVYNESDGVAIPSWDIFISNSDGSDTYNETGNTNPLNVNTSDFPIGDPVFMEFSADNYKNRYYYYTLATINNQWYNLSAFLLPEGEDVLKTTSVSIPDPTVDVVITLECIPSYILVVQGYNESLYGHWFEIPDDKYSLVSNVVTVNKTVLDANTSLVKVSYYCVRGTYANLYYIIVVDEYDQGIEDVYVRFKRYISTEGAFRNVSTLYTDEVGQINIYLQPGVQYKVNMSKTDYITTEEDYIADPDYYGLGFPKYFELPFEEEEKVTASFGDICTFTGEWETSNNTLKVYFYDKNSETEDATFEIYKSYNDTLTLNTTRSYTNQNTITFYISDLNTSRAHVIMLEMNHTTLGHIINQTIYVNPLRTADRVSHDWLEGKFSIALGDWQFGYVNFLIIWGPAMLILIGLASIGHPGIAILGAGLYITAISWELQINLETVFISLASIFIVLGIIILIIKKRRS